MSQFRQILPLFLCALALTIFTACVDDAPQGNNPDPHDHNGHDHDHAGHDHSADTSEEEHAEDDGHDHSAHDESIKLTDAQLKQMEKNEIRRVFLKNLFYSTVLAHGAFLSDLSFPFTISHLVFFLGISCVIREHVQRWWLLRLMRAKQACKITGAN